MTTPSIDTMSRHSRLGSEDGLFELGGTDSVWIWVHTCPTPKCKCRTALVLSSPGGRDALLRDGAPVRDAWENGTGDVQVAADIPGLMTFCIDIDSAEVVFPVDDEPLDLVAHPEIHRVANRLDGDTLDAIGRLWYQAKGLPIPSPAPTITPEAEELIEDGVIVPWDEVFTEVRQDSYVLDDRLYAAVDMYCVQPGCTCGEVVISFETVQPRGGAPAGSVTVHKSGEVELEFEPHKKNADRLERLWAAYRQRYPRFVERLFDRDARMKQRGRSAPRTQPARAETKVGRNAPCPCGSGKKYKKCCGRPGWCL